MSDLGKRIVELENDVESTRTGLGLQIIEIIILSIVLGVWRHSWVLGGVAFVLLLGFSTIRPLAIVLAVVLTLLDGVVVCTLGIAIFQKVAAGVVLGIISLLIFGALHAKAFQYNTK